MTVFRSRMFELVDIEFKSFITPKTVQICFIVGSVLICLAGMVVFWAGIAVHVEGGPDLEPAAYVVPAFLGVCLMFLGPLVVRIICEVVLVLFRIEGHLRALHGAHAPKPAEASGSPNGPELAEE